MVGAPFVKTTDQDLEIMLSLASSKKGGKMVDIGSGDGSIVIAFVNEGLDAYGYEIDPRLVRRSRQKIKVLKLTGNARFILGASGFRIFQVIT